jgi:hypothetical protein
MQTIPSNARDDTRSCPQCGFPLNHVQANICPRCGQTLASADEIENLPTVRIGDLEPRSSLTLPNTTPPGTPPASYTRPAPPPMPAPGGPPAYMAAPPRESPPLPPAPAPTRSNNLTLIIGALIALVVILISALVGVFFVSAQPQPVAASPTAAAPITKIAYQKSFASDGDGWAHDSNCAYQDQAYHVQGSNICYAPAGSSISDATIAVLAQQVSGSLDAFYGLVMRRTDRNNYYEFEVNSKGKWRFAKLVNGTYKDIVSSKADKAINPGLHALNFLQVRMNGAQFTFSINGIAIGSASDSSFAKGSCGIRSGGDGVEAAFNNFLVLTGS